MTDPREAQTGAEVKAQVREALHDLADDREKARRALDGCTVLTAEEEEKVRRLIWQVARNFDGDLLADGQKVLAILGADE